MIVLNTVTVPAGFKANQSVATFTYYDYTLTARPGTNFILDETAAGVFGLSGSNLVILSASVPVGFYPIKVTGVTEFFPYKDKAHFVIQVQ
jgi:hypothetical protein